jgi:hypothetical protein
MDVSGLRTNTAPAWYQLWELRTRGKVPWDEPFVRVVAEPSRVELDDGSDHVSTYVSFQPVHLPGVELPISIAWLKWKVKDEFVCVFFGGVKM